MDELRESEAVKANEVVDLEKWLKAARSETEALRLDLGKIEGEALAAQQSSSEIIKETQSLRDQVAALHKERASEQQAASKLHAELAAARRQLLDVKAQTSGLPTSHGTAAAGVPVAGGQPLGNEAAHQVRQSEAHVAEQIEALNATIASLRERAQVAEKDRAVAQNQLKEAYNETRRSDEKVVAVERDLDNVKANLKIIQDERGAIKKDMADLEERNARLREIIDTRKPNSGIDVTLSDASGASARDDLSVGSVPSDNRSGAAEFDVSSVVDTVVNVEGERFAALEQVIAELTAKNDDMLKNRAVILAEKAKADERGQLLETELHKHKSELTSLHGDVRTLRAENAELRKEGGGAVTELRGLRQVVEEKSARLESVQTELSEIRTSTTILIAQLESDVSVWMEVMTSLNVEHVATDLGVDVSTSAGGSRVGSSRDMDIKRDASHPQRAADLSSLVQRTFLKLQRELEAERRRATVLHEQYTEGDSEKQTVVAQLAAARKETQDTASQLDGLRTEKEALERALGDLRKKHAVVESELQELQNKHDDELKQALGQSEEAMQSAASYYQEEVAALKARATELEVAHGEVSAELVVARTHADEGENVLKLKLIQYGEALGRITKEVIAKEKLIEEMEVRHKNVLKLMDEARHKVSRSDSKIIQLRNMYEALKLSLVQYEDVCERLKVQQTETRELRTKLIAQEGSRERLLMKTERLEAHEKRQKECIGRLEAEVQEHVERFKGVSLDNSTLREGIGELKDKLSDLQVEHSTLQAACKDKSEVERHDKIVAELKASLSAAEKKWVDDGEAQRKAAADVEAKHYEELKGLQAELREEQEKQKLLRERDGEDGVQVAVLRREIRNLQDEKEAAERRLDLDKKVSNGTVDQLKILHAKAVEKLEDMLSSTKLESESVQLQLSELTVDAEKAKGEAHAMQQEVIEMRAILDAKDREISHCKNSVKDSKMEAQRLETINNKLVADVERIRRESQEVRRENDDLCEKIQALQLSSTSTAVASGATSEVLRLRECVGMLLRSCPNPQIAIAAANIMRNTRSTAAYGSGSSFATVLSTQAAPVMFPDVTIGSGGALGAASVAGSASFGSVRGSLSGGGDCDDRDSSMMEASGVGGGGDDGDSDLDVSDVLHTPLRIPRQRRGRHDSDSDESDDSSVTSDSRVDSCLMQESVIGTKRSAPYTAPAARDVDADAWEKLVGDRVRRTLHIVDSQRVDAGDKWTKSISLASGASTDRANGHAHSTGKLERQPSLTMFAGSMAARMGYVPEVLAGALPGGTATGSSGASGIEGAVASAYDDVGTVRTVPGVEANGYTAQSTPDVVPSIAVPRGRLGVMLPTPPGGMSPLGDVLGGSPSLSKGTMIDFEGIVARLQSALRSKTTECDYFRRMVSESEHRMHDRLDQVSRAARMREEQMKSTLEQTASKLNMVQEQRIMIAERLTSEKAAIDERLKRAHTDVARLRNESTSERTAARAAQAQAAELKATLRSVQREIESERRSHTAEMQRVEQEVKGLRASSNDLRGALLDQQQQHANGLMRRMSGMDSVTNIAAQERATTLEREVGTLKRELDVVRKTSDAHMKTVRDAWDRERRALEGDRDRLLKMNEQSSATHEGAALSVVAVREAEWNQERAAVAARVVVDEREFGDVPDAADEPRQRACQYQGPTR